MSARQSASTKAIRPGDPLGLRAPKAEPQVLTASPLDRVRLDLAVCTAESSRSMTTMTSNP